MPKFKSKKKFRASSAPRSNYRSPIRSETVFGLLDRFNLVNVLVIGVIAYLALFRRPKKDELQDLVIDDIKFDSNNVNYSPQQLYNFANQIQTAFAAANIGGTDTNTIYNIVNPMNCDELDALRVAYGLRVYKPWFWSQGQKINLDSAIHQELAMSSSTAGKAVIEKFNSCPI